MAMYMSKGFRFFDYGLLAAKLTSSPSSVAQWGTATVNTSKKHRVGMSTSSAMENSPLADDLSVQAWDFLNTSFIILPSILRYLKKSIFPVVLFSAMSFYWVSIPFLVAKRPKRCLLELLLELFDRSDRGNGPKLYGHMDVQYISRYPRVNLNKACMGKALQKMIYIHGDVYQYFFKYIVFFIDSHALQCIGNSKLRHQKLHQWAFTIGSMKSTVTYF